MYIERVQIEEGFLDGLDVSFTGGLNVIIGERGTGKTSLIELIRFCLGVQGYTSESRKRSLEHALSVLGSGQVTITLSDGEHQLLVARTGEDKTPRASERFAQPIIFSQTEIETIGLEAQGRLRLLDSFIGTQRDVDAQAQEEAVASEVRSLTAEVEALRREIEEFEHHVEEISALEKQIEDLSPQEQELAKVSAEANEKKTKLDTISSRIAASAVGVSALERFHHTITRWQSSLSAVVSGAPFVEPWPEGAGSDPLGGSRAGIHRAQDYLDKAVQELEQVSQEAQMHLQSSHDRKLKIEDQARQLRKEVEILQEGASVIIRQGQQLRERKAQLDSLAVVLMERRKSLVNLFAKRGAVLDKLDEIREKRFSARNHVAATLTKILGPRIRVEASRAGQFQSFAAAIADALRGSGLRYNELSPMLAKNISPRELLEAVDTNDVDLIADATGVTKARAHRALMELRESDLGTLATVDIKDTVSLHLLDGATYKSIGELSTGQRCTVILPLVLQQTDHILIVDQPEDHIDNAFITDTLILSVLERAPDSQIIFTTHNANIPVLGNANHVVQLGSDGKRGFSILASGLQDRRVVEAITTVMEGGVEAFNRRASFYRKYATS